MSLKHYIMLRAAILLTVVCLSAVFSGAIYYLSTETNQKQQNKITIAATSKILEQGSAIVPNIQTSVSAKELKNLSYLSAEIRDLYFIKESSLGVISDIAQKKLAEYKNKLKIVPIKQFSAKIIDKNHPILFVPAPDSNEAPIMAKFENEKLKIYTDKKFKIKPEKWSEEILSAFLRFYLKKGEILINGQTVFFLPSESENIQKITLNDFNYYLNEKEAQSQVALNF